MNELTYHDLKEEQELANRLIQEDKTVLVREIINKNRQLDEYEKEINELNGYVEWYFVAYERIDRARKYIEDVYNSLENVDRPILFYEKILEILKGENK